MFSVLIVLQFSNSKVDLVTVDNSSIWCASCRVPERDQELTIVINTQGSYSISSIWRERHIALGQFGDRERQGQRDGGREGGERESEQNKKHNTKNSKTIH